MFRSIFTKSLRDYRVAILGWGIGLGFVIYSQYATYSSFFNSTTPAQLTQLVNQFAFFGESHRLDTPGGFATFKVMGLLPVILGIWTILAGSRMTRGEEESGALDIVLSTPQSRTRVLAQKALALAAATGLISVLIGLLIMGGMASAKTTVDPGGAMVAAFDSGLTALFFGFLALLLAQFMARGAAAGWAGALMALAYVLDGTGRSNPSAAGLRTFSPIFYYDKSTTLVPGYGPNWGALAVLVVLSLIAVGIATPLFLRRDIGRTVQADLRSGGAVQASKPAGAVLAQSERSVWVRGVGAQALRRQGSTMFWWIASVSLIAGYFVVVAKSSEKQFQDLLGGSTFLKDFFNGTNIGTNNGFLAVLVFGYLPIVVTIFAGIIAYRWSTDLDKGRLELLLSTPQPRWRVILERYAAVLIASLAMVVGIFAAVELFALAIGFTVDAGAVAGASFGILPLELVTASLVFALAGLLPPGAVIGIMAVFVGVSFLADLLRTILHLPDWALNASIFHQYGTPVLNGLNWGAFVGMLVVAAALLALGGLRFASADLDRGA